MSQEIIDIKTYRQTTKQTENNQVLINLPMTSAHQATAALVPSIT